MWQTVVPVLTPVLVSVSIGWVWARAGRPYDSALISQLVMGIGAPCLVVSTLGSVSLPESDFWLVGKVYVLVLALTALAALLLIRLTRRSLRVYFPALVFPNVGNMGLPLCMLAFGQAGLALALAWFMLNSVLHFSVGQTVVSGQRAWVALVSNPIILSVFVAVAMVVGDWQLPVALQNSVELIGGLTIPLMLITLGVSLARLGVRHVGDALLFAVARLVIGLLAGWLVCEWLALEGVLRGIVLIQSSMPVAVFNYLFAERYQQGPERVAGMVVVSTLLSFLLLPWLLQAVVPGVTG
jgi:hypothetical protein